MPKIIRLFRPRKYSQAEYIQAPSADACYRALADGFAKDRAQEKTLRLLAWRKENDLFRGGSIREWNLRALANGLLDENDEWDCLLKAEALREAGQFKSALEVLDRHPNSDFAEGTAEIRRLCLAGEFQVRPFPIWMRKSDEERARRTQKERERLKRDQIEAIRQKAIAIGIATPENVDEVLYAMNDKQFAKHCSGIGWVSQLSFLPKPPLSKTTSD